MAHNTQHILPLCTATGKILSTEDVAKQSEQILLGEELIEKYKAMMHDIADMEAQFLALQKHLYEQESLRTSILQLLSEPLFWYNTHLELQGFNQGFCDFFKLDGNHILYKPIATLLPQELIAFITKEQDKTKTREGRLLEYMVDDVPVSLFVDKTPMYTKENTLQGYMVYLIDTTELRKKDAQIEYHATHDELTGLLNRFAIQNRIQHTLTAGKPFAIALLDIDKFSDINKIDVALGDEYLQILAHRLESIFPHNDVAHVGADEFIILFTTEITKQALETTLREALNLLSPPIVLNEYEFLQKYTFSVTLYPDDGDDVDSLWQNLLITMEQARLDNVKIAFFKKSFADTIHLQSKRKEEIKRALAAHDILNAYQARIDTRTRAVVAFEALARIRSIDGTIQLPAEFIVEAEYSDLIQELGKHVLYNACLYAVKVRDILPHITISVNISPKQFSMELISIIDSVIQQSGIHPKQLELEITESVMIRDIKRAKTILEHIASRGIGIAIDDFGKGYSSLYYIKDLPINTLKIDKDFTQDALTNPRSAAIVRTVIALGNDLGMQVVAEGIETREHFEAIQEYRCTQLQGDYISPPLLEEQALAWIENIEVHTNILYSHQQELLFPFILSLK